MGYQKKEKKETHHLHFVFIFRYYGSVVCRIGFLVVLVGGWRQAVGKLMDL
jgi:hypothetical protein